MALIFLKPDPVDGRIYPKKGTITKIADGFVTLREKNRTFSIPVDGVLRIEWEEGEEER